MIMYGVQDILGQCNYITRNWNNEITLTEEVIKTISHYVITFKGELLEYIA